MTVGADYPCLIFPWHCFILDRFTDPNLNEDLGIGPQLFFEFSNFNWADHSHQTQQNCAVVWLVCPIPQFETPLVHSPWPPHPSVSFFLSLSLSLSLSYCYCWCIKVLLICPKLFVQHVTNSSTRLCSCTSISGSFLDKFCHFLR